MCLARILYLWNKNEWDCKPGSVVNDHLSGINVTANLKRPTWEQIGQIYGSLFGLASDGVYMCPVCYQPGGSLLHCPSTLTRQYWRFISVALSLESPPPDVIRHPALWSPDFPHLSPFGCLTADSRDHLSYLQKIILSKVQIICKSVFLSTRNHVTVQLCSPSWYQFVGHLQRTSRYAKL